jgi:hypothetical protein
MHCALPPSEPPDGERPRCFRLAAVGGAQLRGGWHHRSASRIFIRQPGCIPSPMVTQDGDHQFDGGEKQAGLRPLPRPQLQGSSSSLLGRGASRACLRMGWRPASSSGIWGWKPSSSYVEEASSSHAGGRRTAAARPGCNIPSSIWATVAGRTGGSHNTSYAARAVLVF